MAIVKAELDCVVPYLGGRLCARLRLIQRKNGRGRRGAERNGYLLLAAFIVAGSAGTVVAKQRKIKMASVPIGPGDVDTRASLHVDFHFCGFSAWING